MTIENLSIIRNKIIFDLPYADLKDKDNENLYMRDKQGRKHFLKVKKIKRDDIITFEVELDNFVETYKDQVSRWHLYLELTYPAYKEVI